MEKKTVAILGATGMLGSALYGVLKDRYRLLLAVRDVDKISLLEREYGAAADSETFAFDASQSYKDFLDKRGYPGEHLSRLFDFLRDADYVINAIGVTIPFSLENREFTFFINGALPHLLAARLGRKLIHITTDCVYDGKSGFPYDEKSPISPVDFYGLSKSIGEPTACLTLRTSIIGKELEGFTGLLEWFLSQKGNTITGFANHFWNGVTTKQFGKICAEIMSRPERYPRNGVYHIFSTTVSKYDMLVRLREKYDIDCEIKKDETQKLNRTLGTIHDFNASLKIPSFDAMVREL